MFYLQFYSTTSCNTYFVRKNLRMKFLMTRMLKIHMESETHLSHNIHCDWCYCCRFVSKRSGSCSRWNWDSCKVSLLCLAPYQWHLQSGAKSFIQNPEARENNFNRCGKAPYNQQVVFKSNKRWLKLTLMLNST